MSLFGTINHAAGALNVAQIGLQTVGNNIANANTDGYIRQELIQTTPAPYRKGNLVFGHGVRPGAIVQKMDHALAERMWEAGSDLAGAKLREQTLAEIESLLNDLNGGGLSDDLVALNSALHDLSSDPNNPSLREFVVLAADSLSTELRRTYAGVREYQTRLNSEMNSRVDRVNSLAEKIADLNLRIMTVEGGRALASDATGLRDERYRALEELSELVKVRIEEQTTGSVSVLIGGDYLVAETYTRPIFVDHQREENSGVIKFTDTGAEVRLLGGELAAMSDSRDTMLGGVLEGLDGLSLELIRQFNTVHSQGQGRRGFESLTGTVALDAQAPIGAAGLTWPVTSGSFEIRMVDAAGNHLSQHRIDIRTGDASDASTVESIVADLNAIDGLTAQVLPGGQLRIDSDIPGAQFTFGEDTTGFVGAAGLNTLFAGHSAETIGINPLLKANPDLLAISAGGIGNDTDTLTQLVDLVDRSPGSGAPSIRQQYSGAVDRLAQVASNQKAATAGMHQYYSTLHSEHLAVSGVNIDEEAIKMVAYQRAFQASSRVIATATEMLEILMTL